MSANPIKYFLRAFVLNIAIFASSIQSEQVFRPQVTIPQGNLQGTTYKSLHSRNISTFLGIPYAQPPIGELRFANPVAATGWSEIRDASIVGNMCIQAADGGILGKEKSNSSVIGDEDCLYLNVYTPEVARDSSRVLLPVMVFIHGGAFVSWSSAPSKFGPQYLLDKDIVLVTFNYRLGAVGFLSTGDESASGNWGFKDQILALKWVRDNIGFFGGDPDQVTIFGQSSGAISVQILALSPATTGLFHRYITESGSALSTTAYQPRAYYKNRAYKLSEFVGCPNDTTSLMIECLRTVSASEFIDVNSQFVLFENYTDIVWSATDEPNIEGAVLIENPAEMFAAGKIRDLPWLAGITRNEGLLYTGHYYENLAGLDQFFENLDVILPILLNIVYMPDVGEAWVKAIKSYYFNDLTADKSLLLANLTNFVGDSIFFYPTYNAVQQQSVLASNPQYFYIFDYMGTYSFTNFVTGSTVNYGVAHCDDLIYLLSSSDFYSNVNRVMSEDDYKMVDIMVELWTSFAHGGKPSISFSNYSTTWKPFVTLDDIFRIRDESSTTSKTEDLSLKERKQFWASLDKIKKSLTIKSDNAKRKSCSFGPKIRQSGM